MSVSEVVRIVTIATFGCASVIPIASCSVAGPESSAPASSSGTSAPPHKEPSAPAPKTGSPPEASTTSAASSSQSKSAHPEGIEEVPEFVTGTFAPDLRIMVVTSDGHQILDRESHLQLAEHCSGDKGSASAEDEGAKATVTEHCYKMASATSVSFQLTVQMDVQPKYPGATTAKAYVPQGGYEWTSMVLLPAGRYMASGNASIVRRGIIGLAGNKERPISRCRVGGDKDTDVAENTPIKFNPIVGPSFVAIHLYCEETTILARPASGPVTLEPFNEDLILNFQVVQMPKVIATPERQGGKGGGPKKG